MARRKPTKLNAAQMAEYEQRKAQTDKLVEQALTMAHSAGIRLSVSITYPDVIPE